MANNDDDYESTRAENRSLFWHYFNWRTTKSNAVTTAAKEIQEEVYQKLPNVTPVRSNVSEVNHITANRYNDKPAVRVRGSDKEQPGATRAGWIKSTVTLNGERVYAVRNKNRPIVIHLLNFNHDHYSHGKRAGEIQGSNFVTDIQDEANEKLHTEIERIFEEEEK